MKDKPFWEKPAPEGKPKSLSVKKKAAAKRRAKAAGRPYPNLVDNLAVARKKRNYAEGGSVGEMTDEELAKAFSDNAGSSALIGEVNRRIREKLLARFKGDKAAAQEFLRNSSDPLSILLGR